MNEPTNSDLMAAILNLQEATGLSIGRLDGKVDRLRDDMNRRFDRVDERFDALAGRVVRLEKAIFDDPAP